MKREDKIVNVFANGIWKSGNHLLLKILQQLDLTDEKVGIAASLINGKYFFARQIARGALLDVNPVMVGLEKATCISSHWLNKRLSDKSAVYVGGHAAYSEQLLNILELNNFKSIQIIRDPRDVVVSFAHWIGTRPDFFLYKYFSQLDMEGRMKLLIMGGASVNIPVDSIATVLDRSYGWIQNSSRVLTVKFEDLVGEKGGGNRERQIESIRDICKWLGKDEERALSISENLYGGTKTFRKGQSTTWKEEMPKDIQELFHHKVGGRLQLYKYEE